MTANYEATVAPNWETVIRAKPAMGAWDITADMMGNITSDPVQRVYSSGLRNIPDSAPFRAATPGWDGPNKRFVQAIDTTKAEQRDGSVWQLNQGGITFELEHYFECRFAGRIYVACCTGANADATSPLALALLDRLTNKASNIAWTTAALNSIKTGYFGGKALSAFNNPALVLDLQNYLTAARVVFSSVLTPLIVKYSGTCTANSAILRMLKVIVQSPFCAGPTWQAVMAQDTWLK